VQRPAGRVLGDLLAATKFVGNEKGFRRGAPDGGQKHPLGQGLRNLELLALKAEGAGHAAAPGVEQGNGGPSAAEQIHLGVHFHQRLMVAVAVQNDSLSGEIGRLVAWRTLSEKVAQYICLVAKGGGAGVLWEEIP